MPPPLSTAAAQRMVRVLDALGQMPRRRAAVIAVVGLPALVALDVATGRNVSLSIAYTLLVCFTAWTLGERRGLAMALAVALSGLLIPYGQAILWTTGWPTRGVTAQAWNFASRAMSAGLLVLLVNGLQYTLALERWRADTDGLTGVLNKSAFRRRMSATIAHARRTGRAVVLAYMDLDGFKQVNDAHGHSAGDGVLTLFAHEAAAAIRTRDLFARIGGDEFVALLMVPDCDCGDAVAEMLHDRLTRILQATGFGVTCSMGALVMESGSIGPEDDVIAMADALMYEVKRSGKNALRIARGEPIGQLLRDAFPPQPSASFDALIAHLDRLDSGFAGRRAA